MNNIITKIEIDSFRSIRKQVIDLAKVNVFSGLNDVGKSNVLKALNLFFNGKTDFGTSFNFPTDFSKVSLASAQRSAKKKQQVKIKVYFRAPASLKSLAGKELWIEKVFDRENGESEHSSLDGEKARSSLTRLLNSIQYFYIPALKGPDVMQYILGEIGKRKLIGESDIQSLNNTVNKNIADLANILVNSSIQTETKFELPVLVEDFWQKLNINTTYDEFEKLEKEINPSKKGSADSLKKEFYQVPLQLRGEGVKSKHIPPLLQWIQKKENNRHYIWGIDEPENSLEFKKAQEVARLYFDVYCKNTQLLLTSHSLAFIFPESDSGVSVFRCTKGELGETRIELLKNLFKEQDRKSLAEEIGALEVQKSFYDEWRKKDEEITDLKIRIESRNRPLVVTEGNNIAHIKKAVSVLDPSLLSKIEFLEGAESKTGSDQMKTAFEIVAQRQNGHKILFVWDCDQSQKVGPLTETSTTFKYCILKNGQNARVQKGIENLYPQSTVLDEHYSQKEEIDAYGAIKLIQNFEKQKFLETISQSGDHAIFENFRPLIEKIKKII